MKLLISKRKLTRLSFVMMCILCGYGFYQVYLLHFQHSDLTQSLGDAEKFEVYGAVYVQNGMGDNPQKAPPMSSLRQEEIDYDSEEHDSWPSFTNGVQDEPFPGHSASPVPLMGIQSPQIQAYMDPELSENLMDIHDMDNVDVNPLDGFVSPVADNKENHKRFHYPDVVYRYNRSVNGSRDIQAYQTTPAQNKSIKTASLNIRSVSLTGSNFSNASLPNYKVANSNVVKVKSNVSTTKKTKKQTQLFSNSMPPPPDRLPKKRPEDIRYIVYLCDPLYLCGGWGDRQRGIVSTYLLSRLVDREFKIIMTTPCNLRLFYAPNTVQWQPKAKELLTSSNISINALMDKDFQFTVMEGDFNSKFPQKVIYLKTNQDYYDRMKKNTLYSSILNQWGGLRTRHSRFHWAWIDLMRPSQMILTHLQHIVGTQFLARKGLIPSTVPNNKRANSTSNKRANSTTNIDNSTLICAHVRMGKNPTIPMDENLKSFKLEYLKTLYNFMLSKDLHDDAKFFVATDYDYVRSESKRFFGNKSLDFGGKILHIDRQRGEESACVGFEVALMDQLILSLCDILIVCKSGFSINASFMSNSTGHVYFLKDGVIDLFKQERF